MATYTTNLNLEKPDKTEKVSIAKLNNNMDTIDSAVGSINSHINNLYKIHKGTTSGLSYSFAMPNTTQGLLIAGALAPISLIMVSGTLSTSDVPTGYTITESGNVVTLTKASGSEIPVTVILFAIQ